MNSLQDLNNYASNTITFTDNRLAGVKFSFPTPRDIERVLDAQTFTAERRIDIIEVIKPEEANVTYSIDVSNFPGAVVTWNTIPSGCTVTELNGVYTIDNINSKEIWDIVAAPTITAPQTTLGSYFYLSEISYFDNGIRKSKEWRVGAYIPFAYLQQTATLDCIGTKVFGAQIQFPVVATAFIDTSGIEMIATANIDIDSTVFWTSLAADLTAQASVSNAILGVTPGFLQPTLSISNPNRNTANTNDWFGVSVAKDSDTIAVGAKYEDLETTTLTLNANATVSYGETIYEYDNTDTENPVPTGVSGVCLTQGTTNQIVLRNVNGSFTINDSDYYLQGSINGNLSRYPTATSTSTSTDTGIVYVYDIAGNLIYTLFNPSASDTTYTNDYFGESVILTTDYVIVGAPGEDDEDTPTPDFQDGAIYVFNKSDGSLEYQLTPPTSTTSHYFGSAIAASDTYLVAGSWSEQKVFVYTLSNGNLYQTITGNTSSQFGYSVDVSGSNMVIGAPIEDDDGKIYVYPVANSTPTYTISNPNTPSGIEPFRRFGSDVAISGSYFAGSSPQETHNGIDENGVVHTFSLSTGNKLATIYNPNIGRRPILYPNFGYALEMSDDYLFVSVFEQFDTEDVKGRVWVLDPSDGSQISNQKIYPPNVSVDQFGSALSFDGNNKLLIGFKDNEDSQSVYLYQLNA